MEVCQDRDKNIEKLDMFHNFLSFLESLQAASREFLGSRYCVTERPRHHRIDCGGALREKRHKEKT